MFEPSCRFHAEHNDTPNKTRTTSAMAAATLMATAAILAIVTQANEPNIMTTVSGCECATVSWDT